MASHLDIAVKDIDDEFLNDKLKITKPLWTTLKEMIDVSYLANPLYLLVCISNILGFLALYVPYVYLPNMMHSKGIPPSNASFVISLIGISNTLGRIIVGAFVDLPWVSSMVVTNLSLSFSGVCVIIFPFCHSYVSFIIVALLLGLFVSAYVSLTSIVLVDLLGIDCLTSTFGLLVLFRGVASILGPPLAGVVYDATQEFNASFYMAGAFFIAAGVISEISHLGSKKSDKK